MFGADSVSTASRQEILSVFCGKCIELIVTVGLLNFLIELRLVLNAALG